MLVILSLSWLLYLMHPPQYSLDLLVIAPRPTALSESSLLNTWGHFLALVVYIQITITVCPDFATRLRPQGSQRKKMNRAALLALLLV